MTNPNIYIYRVVFNGGSNGAIFRYPFLIDFRVLEVNVTLSLTSGLLKSVL